MKGYAMNTAFMSISKLRRVKAWQIVMFRPILELFVAFLYCDIKNKLVRSFNRC